MPEHLKLTVEGGAKMSLAPISHFQKYSSNLNSNRSGTPGWSEASEVEYNSIFQLSEAVHSCHCLSKVDEVNSRVMGTKRRSSSNADAVDNAQETVDKRMDKRSRKRNGGTID
jgi:hypothetical protein